MAALQSVIEENFLFSTHLLISFGQVMLSFNMPTQTVLSQQVF